MTLAAGEGAPPQRARLAAAALDRNVLVLGAIVLVALAIRLPFVAQPLNDPFSWREASTAMMADRFRTDGWNIFYPAVSWTGPGPSYQGREFQLLSYTSAILDALLGWRDWTGRAVALAFGMVTLVSLHRLAAAVWDEAHAHFVAAAYALLPAAVAIDTAYLPDPSMLAMITLGLWLYVRYWQGGPGWLLWAGTAAFTLGALSKAPGLGAGLAIAWLMVVAARRGDWSVAWRTALGSALGLGCVAAYYAWVTHLALMTPPHHIAGQGYIWDYGLQGYLARGFFLESAYWTVRVWFYGLPLMALIAVGLWFWPSAAELRRDGAVTLVPLAWLAGGAAVYFVAAKEINSNPWNFHMFSVPLCFLAGRGAKVLVDAGRGTPSLTARIVRGGVLGTLLVLAGLLPALASVKKPDRDTARLLGENVAGYLDGELAVLVGPEVGSPAALYYSRGVGWVFPPADEATDWSLLYDDDPTAIAALEDLRRQGARYFGVTRDAEDKKDRGFFDHLPGLVAHLGQTGTVVADTPDFVVWRLDPPA